MPKFPPRMLTHQKELKEELVKYFDLIGVEELSFHQKASYPFLSMEFQFGSR